MNTGYGALLTSVTLLENNTINKKSVSQYGNKRIINEINFYIEINKQNINFPMPKIYKIDKNNYFFQMEYLKNFKTYYEFLKNKNKDNIQNKILNDMNTLHLNKITVNKDLFDNNLILETYGKIIQRYDEIKDIITKYKYIKTVNNLKIYNFDYIVDFIKNYIDKYISNNKLFEYSIIHGDLHLNNIMVNEENNIRYIDPKGSFGNSELYGIKEYDYAKFYFGLGGYSHFDNKIINNLDINNNNINININIINEYKYNNLDLVNIFIMCIWLGNAHCFKNNEYKVVESFFYALYVSTKFIINN
jgi:tRNA A-37 threonylcarbamoyl transferase component Bud32